MPPPPCNASLWGGWGGVGDPGTPAPSTPQGPSPPKWPSQIPFGWANTVSSSAFGTGQFRPWEPPPPAHLTCTVRVVLDCSGGGGQWSYEDSQRFSLNDYWAPCGGQGMGGDAPGGVACQEQGFDDA